MRVVAFDTETDLIAVGNMVPRLVCASFCYSKDEASFEPVSWLVSDGDGEQIYRTFREMLVNEDLILVGANTAYDMAVMARAFPDLIPLIYKAYEAKRVHDVQIREGVMKLSTDGDCERDKRSLAYLGETYGWRSRTAEKKGEDVWRLRYSELHGIPAAEYPEAARAYALEDAEETMFVWMEQTALVEAGEASDTPHEFHAAAGFALQLASAVGFRVDSDRVDKLDELVGRELSPARMGPLYEAGVLTPAQPARPYANGCGKMTQPKAEKKNTKRLQALVKRVAEKAGVPVQWTSGGQTGNKQVATDKDFLALLDGKDEILDLYSHRQKYVYIRDNYLPNLRQGIIYGRFNPLVNTGRASARKETVVPSLQLQNLSSADDERSVRQCLIPRVNHLFLSEDYGTLELCCVGQKTYELFGRSVHRDKINAGYDLHAFLGAQICLRWESAFRRVCQQHRLTDPDEAYELFLGLKESEPGLYKHFRKMAKPTGLGYPGGLGPDKFTVYARGTFGVEVTVEEADGLREMWRETYPEMPMYFDWVNTQEDAGNPGFYRYVSPLGMVRANCTFCAMANGFAMQTPAAEGAKAAMWRVSQACYDPTLGSVLLGSRINDFVHDELMLEVPDDALVTQRAHEVSRIMIETMRVFLPDIEVIRVEPALMDRWYKGAEPVYDDSGSLIPWKPELELTA